MKRDILKEYESPRVIINRGLRYCEDSHDPANWCKVCGLYYCWHPECTIHKNDIRACGHKFTPDRHWGWYELPIW